ncbi:hypothetical protein [Streptomyces alkaliterrae]|uniref:WXG100 family type VII secretion target n=1 Tax=Streptomyces alkaliterrae TaxID=2213162 RepID=A0A5P0YZQ5_9ACTN|nr:hypothetical protein [Streptomyces alkaliterrae]MBB1261235.1 hypothetical protein [Streptomyces alkaliterrae]MQS05247.1 hypothetical protein [Streptomyces alkaliterrae]
MSFKVYPPDIRDYGVMVERAAGHTQQAKAFLDKLPELRTSAAMSKLWGAVTELHEEQREKAGTALKAYRRALAASAAELERSSKYYAETDDKEAAALDSTYPASKRSAPPQPGVTEAAASNKLILDAEDPLAAFDRRGDYTFRERLDLQHRQDAMTDALNESGLAALRESVGNVLDFFSPTMWVNEIIYIFTNRNLLDEMAHWVTGDWESFEECAKGWESLATFCSNVSTNLSTGNNALSVSWNGNAADSAWHYFDSLTSKLKEAEEAFSTLYSHYNKIAEQIAGFVNHLKAVVSLIVDLALIIALEMILASKAAASVVGAPAAAALMAAIAYKVVRIISLHQSAETALLGLFVTLNAIRQTGTEHLEQQIRAIRDFPVPGKSYDHKAV